MSTRCAVREDAGWILDTATSLHCDPRAGYLTSLGLFPCVWAGSTRDPPPRRTLRIRQGGGMAFTKLWYLPRKRHPAPASQPPLCSTSSGDTTQWQVIPFLACVPLRWNLFKL